MAAAGVLVELLELQKAVNALCPSDDKVTKLRTAIEKVAIFFVLNLPGLFLYYRKPLFKEQRFMTF